MLILVLLMTTGYLGYLLWEKWANDRAIKSFRYIIHVNGIRGKTGTCRLIDAHLRAPATGSSPRPPAPLPAISVPTGLNTKSAVLAMPTLVSNCG